MRAIRQHAKIGDREGERGMAIAELSILLTVMLLIAVALFEFGRGFHTYESVVQAAREGARAAMDTTNTDAQIISIASTAASPVSVTVTVSHVSGVTTVTATSTFTTNVPLVSAVWGGGPLVMSRSMMSE